MRPTPKGLLTAGATALGVAAVLVLNPGQGGPSVASTVADGATASGASSTVTSADSSETGGDSAASSSAGAASSGDSAPLGASDSATATSGVTGTYTGQAYSSPYGEMQVEVTLEDGTITSVTWVQLPSDEHSQRINDKAAPTLVSEALAAQSADVASVSGATYTSEGFRSSLQSALTEAGL